MNNTLKTLALSILLIASLHSAQAAQPSISHTYVSGAATASDTYPCSRSAPCATFQFAADNTASGGVVTALDAGDYGHVSINQAMTIDGSGTQASIVTGSGVNPITINAGAGNTVILRHLSLIGLANTSTNDGIGINTGNLVVDDCKISGFVNADLFVNTSGAVTVKNSSFGGSFDGIFSQNTGLVSLSNVTLQGNHYGLDAEGGPVDISHSLITQNSQMGLYAKSSTVSASGCMISGNGQAVYADTSSVIRLTNNDILNNLSGILTSDTPAGIVSTTGDNRKAGNGTPGAPTPGKVIVTQ